MFLGAHTFANLRLQIRSGSIAERVGLKIDDTLVRVNGEEAGSLTFGEACEEIEKGNDSFDMVIER